MAVEQVSVNILRILGLEATDDVDMESYKGFLREKLVMISMGKSSLSRDEEILIQEEFKRVKSKPGSVKIKKTLVDPNAVFNRRSGSGQVRYLSPASGSLARRVIPQSKAVEDGGALVRIETVIKDIWKNLSDEEKQKKKLERDRKAQKDKEEKAAKESSLEKAAKGIVGALEKTFKPVTDIFKRIRDALVLLFLGWTANRLLDWIQDPKNLKTFNAIVDFLARNAGKLLLLYVALNSPLSKIIRWLGKSFIKFLTRMIVDLVKGKTLLKGARGTRGLSAAAKVLTNPLTVATAGTIGGTLIANEITNQRKATEVQIGSNTQTQTGTNIISPPNLSSGGLIDFGEEGVDKVPAKLTKGEFVVSKPAVDTFGADFFAALNKLGGGTNRPTYTSGIMHAAGGGIVNPVPSQNIAKNKGGYAADTGLDILAPIGSRVVSPVSGILEYAEKGHTRQMGQDANPDMPGHQDQHSVRIKLDRPFEYAGKKVNFFYATHMYELASSIKNKSGIRINAGDFLGKVGVANNVPHLHVGFVEDRNQNSFLNFKEVRSLLSGATVKDSGGDIAHGNVSTDKEIKKSSITFASESDRRLVSAYLNYITQPMGRGLDILPTIDQVSAVPSSSGPGPSPSNPVPSRPATNQNAERVTGAASRQIATPTR